MPETTSQNDYIAQVMACTKIEEVWALHVVRMKELGFDRMLYGSSRTRDDGKREDLADILTLHEGEQSYSDIYFGEELYQDSLTNDWAYKNKGAASWAQVAASYAGGDIPEKQIRILQLNVQFHIYGGYVVSMRDSVPGRMGVIGLSQAGLTQDKVDALWAEHGKEAEMLCNLMHLKIGALPHNGLRRPLTTRQRETLKLYADGKTSRDIATILDVSAATVEKHMRGARDAFGVETTAHAVQKAVFLNQLI